MGSHANRLRANPRGIFSIPLFLLLPAIFLCAVTLSGYLYFSYQQLRSSVANDEYYQVTRLANSLNERLSALQLDMLLVSRSLRSQAGGPGSIGPESFSAIVDQHMDADGDYLRVSYLSMIDGERASVTFPANGLEQYLPSTESERLQLLMQNIGELMRGRPITSFFQLLFDEQGEAQAEAPVLISILPMGNESSPDSVLLSVTDARPLLQELESAEEDSLGEFWLLTNNGFWISGHNNSMTFMAPDTEQSHIRSLYPEAWQSIQTTPSQTTILDSGIVSFGRLCGRISCPEDLDSVNLDPGSWILASFVPATDLGFFSLLGQQPSRWGPMFVLLLIVSVISVLGFWFLGKTMVALRRNEGHLQRANLLQEAFFEKNPEIMFVKNLDGSYTLANEMCRQLAGVSVTELVGKTGQDVFPQELSSVVEQQEKQVIVNEEAMEFHTQWERDGKTSFYKTLRFPMYDQNNHLVAVGGIANDITDQVMSRHALLENERLLRTFIESAPDAVLICDEEGQVTLVNRQAELIFDYDREDMLSLSLFELVSGLSRERLTEAMEIARRGEGDVFREAMEGSGRSATGRSFPVEFSLAPVTTDEGSLIICLLRDVSEKALMETQLRQSQKMEAVGKLTGGMAHDFNNLLGIIVGNLALAMKRGKLDERLEKRLQTAMKAADRGAELTKRMLAIARRQPLQPKPVSINKVIEELSLMLPQTLGSDIEMELKLSPNLPRILVDESGFEGMLLNLAINSRDAMPEGGKFSVRTYLKDRHTLETLIPHARVTDPEYVHIMVKDSGEGMSEEALNRAFEPFFTTKEKGKGTGLGLAMIYGFVKQSKGFVLLDSKLGKGTSVHIYLPVANIEDGMDVDGDHEIAHEVKGQGKTVLVVDDESELLHIASAYLEDMGFNVITALSGTEALEKLDSIDQLDLLLTDVVMPGGLNGVSLVRQVRQRLPDLPVLYASGYPSGVIEENSKMTLDAPLIHKPYTLAVLTAAIAEVMR